MQTVISMPTRFGELAYCPRCLRADQHSGRALYWRREWMDPYVVWCQYHRVPLRGVPSTRLRPLHRMQASVECLEELAGDDRPTCAPAELDLLAELAADAHQLSRALRLAAASSPMAGSRSSVDQIIHLIISELRQANARELFLQRLEAPQSLHSSIILSYTPRGEGIAAAVPTIVHRIALLGLVSRILGIPRGRYGITMSSRVRTALWSALQRFGRTHLASALRRARDVLPCRPWRKAENWHPPPLMLHRRRFVRAQRQQPPSPI